MRRLMKWTRKILTRELFGVGWFSSGLEGIGA